MAKRDVLTVTVSPTGELSIDAAGHHGPACLKAIEEIATAAGKITETVKKPEFHQAVQTKTTLKQGSR